MMQPVERADEDELATGSCVVEVVQNSLVEADAEVLRADSECAEALDVVRE